ncbi:MAG: hypothetical protein ABI779_27265 [Acidobacteriota bacterium]
MPVWKYKRVEDMPEAWAMKGDVPLGRRIRAVLSLGPIAGPLRMPRGVRKYRSIEEANADRDHWEQERVDRIQAEHARKN